MAQLIFLVLVCSALNRARGDDRWMHTGWGKLPGRPLFYVAPILALFTWNPLFGLAYLLWGLPGWGHLFGLGRHEPRDREPSWLEWRCLWMAEYQPHIAFMYRHALAIIPLEWALSYVNGRGFTVVNLSAALFPTLAVVCYEIGWQLWERDKSRQPILIAELLTGCVWGVYAFGAS